MNPSVRRHRHLTKYKDHWHQGGQLPNEGCLGIFEASIAPAHHVPGCMDLSVDLLATTVIDDLLEATQDGITAVPSLKSLRIEQPQNSLGMFVVVESRGDGRTGSGFGNPSRPKTALINVDLPAPVLPKQQG